jgi:hypothetical protein
MQGSLHDIDVQSLLRLIEAGQRSGVLQITAVAPPADRSRASQSCQSWLLFCAQGRLLYGMPIPLRSDRPSSQRPSAKEQSPTWHPLERVEDYLKRCLDPQTEIQPQPPDLSSPAFSSPAFSSPAFSSPAFSSPALSDPALSDPALSGPGLSFCAEYDALLQTVASGTITPEQGRHITRCLTQEVLLDVMGLCRGGFQWYPRPDLSATAYLVRFEMRAWILTLTQQLQSWKQLYPTIVHPDQCPIAIDLDALRLNLSSPAFQAMAQWADGQTSLRRIARYLNRDSLAVAQAIVPYLKSGDLKLQETLTSDQPPSFGNGSYAVPHAAGQSGRQPLLWIGPVELAKPLELLLAKPPVISNHTPVPNNSLPAWGSEPESPGEAVPVYDLVCTHTLEAAIAKACNLHPLAILLSTEVHTDLTHFPVTLTVLCQMLRQIPHLQATPIFLLAPSQGEDSTPHWPYPTLIPGDNHYFSLPAESHAIVEALSKYSRY